MKKAFSLMELMIVIVILGLLAGLVMPNLLSKGDKAKNDLTCIQLHTLEESLNMFKLDNHIYPEQSMGLKALLENPNKDKFKNYAKDGYLKGSKIPNDSWGNPIIYTYSTDKGIDLISFGEDGTEKEPNINLKGCQK